MPEKTAAYIRIPVAERQDGDILRTLTVSKRRGIKGLYAVNRKVIVTYLFARDRGWTMSKAKAWVKEHKAVSFIDLDESGEVLICQFEEGELQEAFDIKEFVEAEKENPKETEEERLIFLFSGVTDYAAESICRKLLQFDKQNSKEPIKIIISSFGGSVYSSFAITDMIEYIKAPVQTIGLGKIMSAGLLIFMAGDDRQISQNASILSHRFSGMTGGSQAEIKARQKEFDIIHNRMIAHYVKHTHLKDKGEVERKALKETDAFLTPEQALEYGMADSYFDQEWFKDEAKEDKKKVEPKAEQYECECIKCGWTVTSETHCNRLKCKKCGGQMRRKSRPGPGQEAAPHKENQGQQKEKKEKVDKRGIIIQKKKEVKKVNIAKAEKTYSYYGYGHYGPLSESFQRALRLLESLSKRKEGLEKIQELLKGNYDSSAKALAATSEAVAWLKKISDTERIIELLRG